MYVSIRKTGTCHPNHHLMRVDNVDVLVDLDCVAGTLVDPTVTYIEWGERWTTGPRRLAEKREFGTIMRQGEATPQTFNDRTLLDPYLVAFQRRIDELAVAPAPPRTPPMRVMSQVPLPTPASTAPSGRFAQQQRRGTRAYGV